MVRRPKPHLGSQEASRSGLRKLDAPRLIRAQTRSGVWQISRLDAPGSAGGALRVVAKASGGAAGASFQPPVARGLPSAVPAIAWAAKPELIVLDIPNYTSESRAGVMAGGYVTPFNRMQISWLSLKWRRLNWTP